MFWTSTRESGRPLATTLATVIGQRRLLVVLDNCEHLLDACAELVGGLLRATPNVRVLATSRDPLAIPDELVYAVPTLLVPAEASEQPSMADVAACDAGRLFVQRARAVAPAFALTADNAPAVAEVCRRLDGIPLARS